MTLHIVPDDPFRTTRDLAASLIAVGVPVIYCRAVEGWDPEKHHSDLIMPSGWNLMGAEDSPDPYTVDLTRGVLAMVGGHGIDVIDIDAKDGGHPDHLGPDIDLTRGTTRTPSGGWHYPTPSTGYAKVAGWKTPAGFLGDYVGGTRDGGGRLIAYLGGTRPKYPDGAYTVETPWNVTALTNSPPDPALLDLLASSGGSTEGSGGVPAARWGAVRAFLGDLETSTCHYGRTAISGLLESAGAVVPGDPKRGRHGWLTGTATRFVELARAGCAGPEDWVAIVAKMSELRGGMDCDAESLEALAWGLTNASGDVMCIDHGGRNGGPDPLLGATVEDAAPAAPKAEPVPIVSLADAHAVFKRWLGAEYDLDALNVVLAAAAVERLDGDPLWVLVVSGSGNAKTETVQAVSDGAVMVSTISSIGALLSGTSKKETAKDASGGLLRQLEPRGLLIIKDVTSILSMSRDARAEVLGALREVHDGSWDRLVGTDGGRTLSWAGRIGVIGAVTTAWDAAHAVIASMGDRFAIVRIDSSEAIGRAAGGRQAMANIGHEDQMRAELKAAAAGVLAGMATEGITLTPDEVDQIFEAANLVTMARTGVEYAYNGDVIDAHAPEAPTRFAKELVQVVRGAVAVGMDRDKAMTLAIRVARDSMPPMRLAIIDDLAEHPGSTTYAVRKRIEKPRTTVDRQLQALHMLGVLTVDEESAPQMAGLGGGSKWRYSLADWVDPATLRRGVDGPGMATVANKDSSTEPSVESSLDGVRGVKPYPGRTGDTQSGYDPLTELLGAQPVEGASS